MNFEQVLTDPDCVSIMNSIVKRYKGLIDRSEAKSFKLEAAWEASENYDPNHPNQMKFSTYLANTLKFKILNFIRSKKVKKNAVMKDRPDSKSYTYIVELLDCLTPQERHLFEQRFLYNISIKELAEEYNLSSQAIRSRCKKLKQKIANYYEL